MGAETLNLGEVMVGNVEAADGKKWHSGDENVENNEEIARESGKLDDNHGHNNI